MVSMDDAGKDASRAIAAIGLDADKLRKQSPDQALRSIAVAFSGYADGAGKSAAAMALMGKEGARMLPFLNDLADAGELNAKLTEAQAKAADEYDKNLKRLSTTGQGWQKELAMGLLPTLDTAVKTFLDMANGAGGLREEVRKLSADGSLNLWAENGVEALSMLANSADGVVRTFKIAGTLIAGFAAKANIGDVLKDIDKIAQGELAGEKFLKRLDSIKRNKAAESVYAALGADSGLGVRQQVKMAPKADSSNAAAKISEYDKLIKSINEKIAVQEAEFAQDEKLTEGQKFATKILEELKNGTLKLTEAQKKNLLAAADTLDAINKQNIAKEKAKKLIDELLEKNGKELDGIKKQISAEKESADLLGLSKEAASEYAIAKLEVAAAAKQAQAAIEDQNAAMAAMLGGDEAVISSARLQAQAYREQAEALGDLATSKRQTVAKEIAVEQAKKSAQAWEEFSKEIESSLSGALMSAFESGGNAGQNFVKSLQVMLKQAALKVVVQAIVQPVTGSIVEALGGPSATGAGSALSLASSGNSLFNLAGGGSSITSGFLGGMASAGSEAALGAAFVGPSASLAGGSVGAGASVGGLFGSSAGAISAALPWIGGALAIASLLGGMFGKGGAPKQNYGTGFIGNATGTIADAPYAKIAGQIGSGQAMTGQDDLQKAIYTDSVKAIVAKYAPSSSYDVLLNSQINVKGKSQNINDASVYGKNGTLYNFGPDTGQGQDAAQSFFKDSIPKLQLAIITDAFRNANADYKAIADSIVGTSTDMTDALSGLSADAVAAMQANLSGMATLFDAIKTQINGSITGEAVASITKLAGGFATLTTQVNDYYSNFYSQEEKASKAHEQLATEFEKLNLAMPSTRDGFRKIVESLDITTEAGQKSFAALMGLSGAFASITDAAEVAKRSLKDIAAERDGLQARLDQAMGNTAAIRQRELDALDPSNRALQQQIYALEDTKAAAEAAAAAQQQAADAAVEAARAAEQAYKDMLAGMLSAVDNAYAGVERAVGAEKSKIDASYADQVSALDAQYQASKAVFESQRATAQQNLSAITQVADRLKSAVKSMQIESDGLLKNQRLMASNTLNAALSASQAGASLANFPGLEDALATVAKPAEQLFSTFQDYAREQGRLGATIGSLGKNADAQVSVAQMTLDSINGASQQAEQIYQRQKEQLASQHAADIKALDDILKNGMDQVDALKGIDKSVLSVAGAMAGLASAIAAYRNASGGGGAYIGGSAASGGGVTAIGGSSAAGAAAASTPISADLSASLSGYMGYDELALQYGKGWADQAMNDPSGSLWTQAILNKLYGGGVDMTAAGLESIFGAGNVPSSAQSFGDSLTQAQWDQVAAATDKTKAFGDIIGGILGATANEQDANHTGIYDQNGFLLANTGNYYVGSGAFTGAEYGLGQLPGSVSLAGEQAIIADNKNIAGMLSGAPSASAVEMLYQSILGRSAESAGVDYWSQQMAAGLTSEQLAAQLMASDEYLKKINGFASGGTASAGYYLAGEHGPELIHSDSATRIYPAEQTSALMARLQSPNESNAVLAAKLDAVIEELNQLRGCAEGTERHTRDTKNILRNVTQDGETLQTTVVA